MDSDRATSFIGYLHSIMLNLLQLGLKAHGTLNSVSFRAVPPSANGMPISCQIMVCFCVWRVLRIHFCVSVQDGALEITVSGEKYRCLRFAKAKK